jgi:predicted AlkP superfamily phosphohydrolase/phosphomutase
VNKLVIFGLDCAEPSLVFGPWLDDLPNLKSLTQKGLWGKLRSTIPPITVPAWTSMMSSQDAGQLGVYGFRNRKSYAYEDLYFANAAYVHAKTVWNHLSRNRLQSLVFGVPQTFPPKPLAGIMVACFLTPDKNTTYTYPAEIQPELEAAADGDYIIDVKDFRTDDKENLLKSIRLMTERRFKAFRHFLGRRDGFDFAIMVEMGIDRIHHGFWRFSDRTHRLYTPGNPYEYAIRDYYRLVDEEIGRTLAMLPDGTSVMVVSDHGAKTMQGAVCINEWLQREGYLRLKEQPKKQTKFRLEMVDWAQTQAWGEGGYYSRIFMNVKGREPQGKIPQKDYEAVRSELKEKLEGLEDENGKCIDTKVFRPVDIYRELKNIPPDLIVYLGNLDWRSAAAVGTGTIHMYENDTGPDDANHAEDGIFIWTVPGGKGAAGPGRFSIYDIAPTILRFYGLEIPQEMIGKPIEQNAG